MAKNRGVQLVSVDNIEATNAILRACVACCRNTLDRLRARGENEFPCKNFKMAIQAWMTFRSFVQSTAGLANTVLADRNTKPLLKRGERDPSRTTKESASRQVSLDAAFELIDAIEEYVGLSETSVQTLRDLEVEELETRNFRTSLDGCQGIARFARTVAGSAETNSLIRELSELQQKIEQNAAQAAAEQYGEEIAKRKK